MEKEKLVLPENWDTMNFGERWIWILDRQEERTHQSISK
jgi:hypothetical protein|tara:strand:- start:8827 stop:8943 length:117 start_codon:yes stop_codon:yes gene_type:complete